MAAVVGEEKYQGVLLESGGFQLIEDTSDGFVQRHDGGHRIGAGGVARELRRITRGFAGSGREDFRDVDDLARRLPRFEVVKNCFIICTFFKDLLKSWSTNFDKSFK